MYIPETQKQIIDYLSVSRMGSCRELSEKLGTTRANIQHHIALLRQKGIIEPVGPPPQNIPSRGRPWRYYRLSGRFELNNYAELANYSFSLLREVTRGENPQNFFADLLAERICRDLPREPHPFRRLTKLIEFLNARYYQASWEAGKTGPRIIIKNCPYASILNENPELCEMDRRIIERTTELKLGHSVKMTLEDNSRPACVFESLRQPFQIVSDQ